MHDRRPAGAGTGRAPTPRSADAASTSASGACTRKIDSQPSASVRIPPAAGPERRAEHTGRHPDAKRARVAALDLREQIERRGDDERGADRLDAAGADEQLERRREPAGERGAGEDDDPDGERVARPPPRDVRRRHGERPRARG